MAQVRPIRSDADHEAALARIDTLMDAAPGTPEREELELLAALVEAYEDKCYPIEMPDPIAAIKFRMEQVCSTPDDLQPLFGGQCASGRLVDQPKRLLPKRLDKLIHKIKNTSASTQTFDPRSRSTRFFALCINFATVYGIKRWRRCTREIIAPIKTNVRRRSLAGYFYFIVSIPRVISDTQHDQAARHSYRRSDGERQVGAGARFG